MHELSITKALISMVLAESKHRNINSITAELGLLTSYKKEPVIYYFNILKKEHEELTNAKCIINEVQGRIRCNSCRKEGVIGDAFMFCQFCNSTNIEIVQGKDFKLTEIKVERCAKTAAVRSI